MSGGELPPEVRQIVASGRYGVQLWAEHEIRRCSEHLERVGQPLCSETAELWLQRRAAGRCPVSNVCPRPAAGCVFCANHAKYDNGSETC